MILQIWIECLNMFTISEQIVNFITRAMGNSKVERITGGQSQPKVKIQEDIFQRNLLSQQLFVTAMIPLNYIQRECKGGHIFTKSQEKINHFICSPISWGCRIHWLPLGRGVNECPRYETKNSVGEPPVILELWGMQSTTLLPSLPGPLRLRVVAPDWVLSMG